MAKLKKPLFGVADGEVHPRTYEAGEDCPPELEEAAAEIDALETEAERTAREKAAAAEAEKAQKAAPENKAATPGETK